MSTIYNDYVGDKRVARPLMGGFGETRAQRKATDHGAIASRLISGIGHVLLWPARVMAARRELEMLASMSEYELKDIGLSRSDVADVTALPADASPTDFLSARVEERHRAKYA
jgi:uncharacterized protein YjiS (DUF1127 family)